jgi:integrase
MDAAQKPRLPAPQPDSPSAEDAARIVAAAWAQDDEWGMVVWIALVTGARRGELLALRWKDVDLSGGTLTIRHSLGERAGAAVMKDTKTHQMRRVSLDDATVELLRRRPDPGATSRRHLSPRPRSPTAAPRAVTLRHRDRPAAAVSIAGGPPIAVWVRGAPRVGSE